jgi:spermidine synthase
VNRALALAFLSGFVALSHEIVWFRVYAYASGGTADAFALMLGAYLTGIALGAMAARALCRDGRREAAMRAVPALLAAGACALFIPPAVAQAMTIVEAWQLTLPLVVAASGLLGAIFPLVSHVAIAADRETGARISYVYLANILGSVCGSLGTGFWLLDRWPLGGVALFLALLGLAAALALALADRGARLRVRAAAIAAAGVACLALAPPLYAPLYEKLQFKTGYRPGERFAHVVENKSGVIAVTRDGTVYGGGAYDGAFNVSLRHDMNGIVRAYALAGLHRSPREVLMIGLSSGSWAAVIAAHPDVEKLTVVEINPGYLQLIARHPMVAALLHDPKVTIEIDDGRRWLVRHAGHRFDAVIVNGTHHWRANASNLLSREFVELVKSRLKPDGVYYFNATASDRAAVTPAGVFAHTLRLANCIAASDAPIAFDVDAWKRVLERYTVAGERVFDPVRPGDRRWLDDLGASLRDTLIEPEQRLRERLRGLEPITDDNMGAEWRL